ncbi:hypothetical protein I532_03950 [Brevibacillus borstelensis AK1]|uniref:Uncharacterized protein n=2 Tax=Brevibacillus borstelensis TaxID=45462 RepID=M8DM73_9BACL|nr:hypothetical protein I532_03950 [Brevibacillus borstelensis AK1]
MSNALRTRVLRIKRNTPIGDITPVGNNGYGRDTAGRIFRIYTLEQLEAARKRRLVERDQRKFSFTNMRNIREITEGLSNKYCGYVLMLQPHIQYRMNVLVTNDSEGRPLTTDDLAKIWNVSRRTAKTVVAELERRSIVFANGDGGYTINERYHFRKKAGSDVDALIKTFFTALKRFRLSAADFGFVYKLLPNVHYATNVICSDPFAENPGDIRFLNERQIAEIVGMAEGKTKEALARLRKAGVIGEWKGADKRETLTVLNPYVFYRKNGEPDETLRALFEAQVDGGEGGA